jgi:hypothetical protein
MQIDGNKRGRNAFKVMRALGFRFVFPIGTLPIPYHPLIAGALAAGGAGMAGQQSHADAARSLFAGGLAADGRHRADPWPAAFRTDRVLGDDGRSHHLIQALLFASAMVLLASEVARGRTQAWLGVLPVAYVAVWLIQRVGGSLLLRRFRRDPRRLRFRSSPARAPWWSPAATRNPSRAIWWRRGVPVRPTFRTPSHRATA